MLATELLKLKIAKFDPSDGALDEPIARFGRILHRTIRFWTPVCEALLDEPDFTALSKTFKDRMCLDLEHHEESDLNVAFDAIEFGLGTPSDVFSLSTEEVRRILRVAEEDARNRIKSLACQPERYQAELLARSAAAETRSRRAMTNWGRKRLEGHASHLAALAAAVPDERRHAVETARVHAQLFFSDVQHTLVTLETWGRSSLRPDD